MMTIHRLCLRRALCARLTITLVALAGLALLAAPATVHAAPALSVTPPVGLPGSAFTVAGTGFAPDTRLVLVIENVVGNRETDDPAGSVAVTVGADGTFAAPFPIPGFVVPGPYTIVAATTPTAPALASASFRVSGPNGEVATVAPESGPAGTTFAVTGANFPAGSTVALAVSPASGQVVPLGEAQVGADGRFTASFDASSLAPRRYALGILPGGGGQPLTTAPFTVTTPAPMPGLPNTGAGGTVTRWGAAAGLVLAAALVALGGAVAHQRRGARS